MSARTATATAEPVPHIYRYLEQSAATTTAGGVVVGLSTSGGCGSNPWLAEGFVDAPQPAARALLLVATVAGTRFWTPPGMVAAARAAADPVVTASDDALRFESFSRCCGVYARFDLDRRAFDGTVHRQGTTNVDVNSPLRAALSRVGARDPLRLSVGREELAVTTLDGRVVEKQVPLPERWVRGFAEVAVAVSMLDPVIELRGAAVRQFLDALPTGTSRGPTWIVPANAGSGFAASARIASRPSPGAMAAGGVGRLRAFRAFSPFISVLTGFGHGRASSSGDGAPTVWCASFDGGRVSLALSPAPSRGFSGEGGLLYALSGGLDPGEPGEPGEPGRRGVADRAVRIEEAAAGRLGYDVAEGVWFPRDLPFDRRVLDRPGGRLASARELVATGAVELHPTEVRARVRSDSSTEYLVRMLDGAWRCTCPWWAKHRGDRGPCKHILATVMARSAGEGPS